MDSLHPVGDREAALTLQRSGENLRNFARVDLRIDEGSVRLGNGQLDSSESFTGWNKIIAKLLGHVYGQALLSL
jgi:hypothetical protein